MNVFSASCAQLSRNRFFPQVGHGLACETLAKFYLVFNLMCLVALVCFSRIPLHHDAAGQLGCSQLFLQGAVPFVDYVTIHPPMGDYLHVLPVFVSQMLKIPLDKVFHVMVFVLVLYSAWAMYRVLAVSPPKFSFSARVFVTATWLVYPILAMELFTFGTKEFEFVLAYVPWLLVREARHSTVELPNGFALLVGFVAAPFILMKPHFCLIVVAVELWMLARSRNLRTLYAPEAVVALAWALAFGVHFFFVPRAMTDAILYRLLPLLMSGYDAYKCSPRSVAATLIASPPYIIPVALAGSAFVMAFGRRISADRRLLAQSLAVAMVMAVLTYIIHHKCWPYQLSPAIGIGIIALSTYLMLLLDKEASVNKDSQTWRKSLRSVGFAVLCLGLLGYSLIGTLDAFVINNEGRWTDPYVNFLMTRSKPGDRILFLSTSVDPAYPSLILADRLPASRHLSLVELPIIYRGLKNPGTGPYPYRMGDERTEEEDRFLEELGQDVLKSRPKLIFIDVRRTCQACPPGFCIDEYLTKIGWKSKYMANYRPLGIMFAVISTAIYERID